MCTESQVHIIKEDTKLKAKLSQFSPRSDVNHRLSQRKRNTVLLKIPTTETATSPWHYPQTCPPLPFFSLPRFVYQTSRVLDKGFFQHADQNTVVEDDNAQTKKVCQISSHFFPNAIILEEVLGGPILPLHSLPRNHGNTDVHCGEKGHLFPATGRVNAQVILTDLMF